MGAAVHLFIDKGIMERLKRRNRWMLTLEVLIYIIIAITVALAIVL